MLWYQLKSCGLILSEQCVRFLNSSLFFNLFSISPLCSGAPALSSALMLKSEFPPVAVFPLGLLQWKNWLSSLKFNRFHLSSNYRTLICVWRLFVEPFCSVTVKLTSFLSNTAPMKVISLHSTSTVRFFKISQVVLEYTHTHREIMLGIIAVCVFGGAS